MLWKAKMVLRFTPGIQKWLFCCYNCDYKFSENLAFFCRIAPRISHFWPRKTNNPDDYQFTDDNSQPS